ncbi:ATP-dependent nuclease [Paramicrobacterium fandaimingii]|uniref:ATP-dependent nuclease n=1 Tax=Paramicrobacterium fandaimingii TaxID=2708079 RepID=UPI001424567C|nr:TOPRIM nucleotidyl transferase/hydrolase domain-containing protein [Microbacterium fandaimingii]
MVQFILIPAATDISANVGTSSKGSTLTELIGAVTNAAGTKARAEWAAKYANALEELNTSIQAGVQDATAHHARRINARLSTMIPEAEVEFVTEVPDWTPKGDPSVSTRITLGDISNDLKNQGHGTQRAVMIAMFQSLAPDEASATLDSPQADGETDNDYKDRLNEIVQQLPTLIVCIEEPEIYQHPIRARAFARVLAELAERQSVQIAVATHSPYFVAPMQFAHLRRLSLTSSKTTVHSVTLHEAAKNSNVAVEKFRSTIERHLPSVFSEGFFADKVVLVEGDTDKVCIEGISEALTMPLDLSGVAVIHVGGKNELKMAYAILDALDVPTYLIVDGDADGASRRHKNGTQELEKARASNGSQTSEILSWLPASIPHSGNLPYSFGDPTLITSSSTVWRDDLESELENWPSFMAELANAGGALRQKKVFTYRAAVLNSNATDMPKNLAEVVRAIHELTADGDAVQFI